MIVTVCGGKGGVGTSTVALNLAAELDAVLVDADLGMADQPTDGGPTLFDVLAGRVDPLAAVRTEWAVGVLPAGRSLAGARSVEPKALASVLESLAETYEHVIVDAPAGFAADTALPIVAADCCVLVTTPDPATLADTVRTRSLARELGTDLGAIVLNRADRTRESVTETLGGPQFAVPETAAIHEAQAAGLPVSLDDEQNAGHFEPLAGHVRTLARDRRQTET
ncbi:chromosome partitioning protein ParA [Halodesulfurarchaeum sp. HSR-GB]|uniref:nucleotide-binding protein n=1 Tax=Halodesulfurarchaeum sp. HSR-GB TaxID=3074077 RepID=UPI0028613CDC|nr:chromosome partitioning protein ParA [Halodesulfurarchaeum sp. HSR-GB]MDR5656063.1 chromosome partitioning protein ParA [Halodesulfurarchaeum sp. HSR-GB]